MILLDFIKNEKNWLEKISSDPYHIIVTTSPPYTIFRYNQLKSDFSHPLVLACRGVIVKNATTDPSIVCWPFDKFFNYGEKYCTSDFDWNSCLITEKIDGSLIKVWFDDTWHISTNNVINAFEAEIFSGITFGSLFMEAIREVGGERFFDTLQKNYTYMFELVSPLTRIVVPYKETKAYLIGIRNNDTGEELSIFDDRIQFPNKPKIYDLNFDTVFKVAEQLPYYEEGYVAVDKKFRRIKIKSPLYLIAHHFKNNGVISEQRILDIIKSNESSEFLSYFPEYASFFETVQKRYDKTLQTIDFYIEESKRIKSISNTRKEFALEVQKFPPAFRKYAFSVYDGREDVIKNFKSTIKIEDLVEA